MESAEGGVETMLLREFLCNGPVDIRYFFEIEDIHFPKIYINAFIFAKIRRLYKLNEST